jgi:hypothetical protein
MDDVSVDGQQICGAGKPIALGVGPKKIRGSSFVEGPMQVGKSGAYSTAQATLMVGQTGNADCPSPDRSVFVKGNVKIEGDKRTPEALLVQGDAKVDGNLSVEKNVSVKGNVSVDGNISSKRSISAQASISAQGSVSSNGGAHQLSAKKNFDIPHPTKEGWRLRHTCPEGPSNDVYVRGRVTNRTEIELPLYWKDLVDIQSITINLTPIGAHQDVIIKRWDENKIYLQAKGGMPIDCFYHVYGTRTDGEDLIVEYQGLTPNDYPGDNSEYNINT